MRLKHATPQSRIKHSTTESLHSLMDSLDSDLEENTMNPDQTAPLRMRKQTAFVLISSSR